MPRFRSLKNLSPPRLRPSTATRLARVVVASFLLLIGGTASAATFIVNTIEDTGDVTPGDGTCSTGNAIVISTFPLVFAAECTLRAAFEEANSLSGLDEVRFSGLLPTVAGVVEFLPATALPPLLDSIFIDGYSHPSYDVPNPAATPIINLGGASTPSGTSGLFFGPGSDDSTVRGLAISNFTDSGIMISSFFTAGPESITIQGNHIGVARGILQLGNDSHGIEIQSADNNVIGQRCGPLFGCSGKRNLIAANDGSGVHISNSSRTQVAGNFIGTNSAGTALSVPSGGPTPNGEHGVFVAESASNTFIGSLGGDGTTTVAAGNLISGNTLAGIRIEGPSTTVVANLIGTNAAGTAPLGNSGGGIIATADDITIGGPGLQSNLVSGNDESGIAVQSSSPFGTPNPSRVAILNNRIGVNTTADAKISNGESGIVLFGDDHVINDNIIGGHSIGIEDASSGTVMLGNHIGTNVSGDDLGNSTGIEVSGNATVVGGAGDGNIIGFNSNGIFSNGSGGARIVGNYIGTNQNGDDLGNGLGLRLTSGNDQVGEIFGRSNGLGNTIGFNGIGVQDDGIGNSVQGNFIGTNSAGEDLGNSTGLAVGTEFAIEGNIGASLDTAPNAVAPAGNEIAFNSSGIRTGFETSGFTIRGNTFSANESPAIDLSGDGATANDFLDFDRGANNRQNGPVFEIGSTTYNEVTGDLDVALEVDSAPASSTYPLTIDFYLHDPWLNPGSQVDSFIGTVTYAEASATTIVAYTLTPEAGSLDPNELGFVFGGLRGIATDAEGNSSELSVQNVPVPEPAQTTLLAGGLLGMITLAGMKGRQTRRKTA